ncbi:MAG: diadenylate cyclase CdaA, partial [Lachnospiraceae bacterium]
MELIQNFILESLSWIWLPQISLTDILEIIILSVLIYYIFVWVKETRAWMLLKGILALVLFGVVAYVLRLSTILWIVSKIINVAFIAVVVVFQPELRRALEKLGQKNLFTSLLPFDNKDVSERFSDQTIHEIVRACVEMSEVRTGALIVIERDIVLREFENTGIAVDAIVTAPLLMNIFEHNTPLHDGAVILRGDRIVTATCYLPLSENKELSKELGTRHRAGVGVSEVSDSMTIIISEETGSISVADDGMLERHISPERLKTRLIECQDKK